MAPTKSHAMMRCRQHGLPTGTPMQPTWLRRQQPTRGAYIHHGCLRRSILSSASATCGTCVMACQTTRHAAGPSPRCSHHHHHHHLLHRPQQSPQQSPRQSHLAPAALAGSGSPHACRRANPGAWQLVQLMHPCGCALCAAQGACCTALQLAASLVVYSFLWQHLTVP